MILYIKELISMTNISIIINNTNKNYFLSNNSSLKINLNKLQAYIYDINFIFYNYYNNKIYNNKYFMLIKNNHLI